MWYVLVFTSISHCHNGDFIASVACQIDKQEKAKPTNTNFPLLNRILFHPTVTQVEALLGAGADPDAQENYGFTALHKVTAFLTCNIIHITSTSSSSCIE